MAITSTPLSGSTKSRRKSNSISTHASSSTVDGSASGSGSGAGRKGKAKVKESWDDDFDFSRPAPKEASHSSGHRVREPSPVPSSADSAIWGDESDAEDVEDTIQLSAPLPAPTHISPEQSLVAAGKASDHPSNRLVKKQKDSLVLIRPQELDERHDEPSTTAPTAMQPRAVPVPLTSITVPGNTAQTVPSSPTEPGKSKAVGRLLGKMSKRFSGTPVGVPSPLAIPSDDQSRIKPPRSSTSKDTKPPVSRTPSIPRSSSSILRAGQPSASTSSLIASQSPCPSSPPSAHTSKGFHLPSPSPRSPYHSAASLHGSTLIPTRTPSHHSDSIPPLPTSASYPVLALRASDPDREVEATEEGEDPARTPRRKKARPVSIQVPVNKKASFREAGLGLGQANSDGWRPNWKGPTPTADASRKKPETSITFDTPLTPTTAPIKPQNTLRRLSSLSKKHGRKLSGGWKFGSSSTLAAALSDPPPLPTVLASPANRPDPLPASASGRVVDLHAALDGVSKAVESWAVLDEEPLLKMSEKRRNSWNDLLIPRDVLAKQKELKAGMSAVRRFAKGVESLKRLKEEHLLLGPGGVDKYAQWWEIAEVLIEVGSTSAAPASDNEMPIPTKALTRERRITLASSAGVPVRSVVSPARATTPRASSDTVYHDVAPGSDENGPPDAGLPDKWRASTGRHDLSKRQLEVLQTMLTTSPLTTSITEASATVPFDRTTRVASATGQGRLARLSPITLPSPGESTNIASSPSFPSTSAASVMNKSRRPSRAGLQGLKDFVRSLTTSSSSAQRSVPLKIFESPPSTPAPGPADPLPPVSYVTMAGADSTYPPTRSSFSALGRNQASGPGSGSHRRPSVRAMFRTATLGPSSLPTDEGGAPRRSITPASHARTLGRDGSRNLQSPTMSSAQSMRIRSLGPVHDADAAITPSNRRISSQIGFERSCETARVDSGRSTSAQSAPVDSRLGEGQDGLHIALTPENLGPLLEALKACEAKLQECLRAQRGEAGPMTI